MNLENVAKDYAVKAHCGQARKSEPEKPMIIHPINVALILKEYGFDEFVIAAGYLHDVVEDTKYEISDIKDLFGEDVASLVYGASEPDKNLSWEERKTHTISEISKLDIRHKAVVAADKINNLEDLYRLMITKSDFDFSNFNRPYDKQKWYYTTLCEKICENETHPIFDKLKEIVNKVFLDIDSNKKYLDSLRYEKLINLDAIKYEIKAIGNCIEKRPYVIEFTGTPRTGKTTIINNLFDFFKKAGFKVKLIEEFTTSTFYKENVKENLLKKSKKTINFEIPKYVHEQLNESLKDNFDVIIIDRSLFDRCIWIDRLKEKNGITEIEVFEYLEKYIPIINSKINDIIALKCSSETCLKRDYEANLSLEKRNFLNVESIEEYNKSLENTKEIFEKNSIKVQCFETDDFNLLDIEIDVVNYILDNMKNLYLKEYINKYS